MPKSGSCALYFSATAASTCRVLEGCGVPSGFNTSHITRIFGALLIGSVTKDTGFSMQSLKCPSACSVNPPQRDVGNRAHGTIDNFCFGTQFCGGFAPVEPNIFGHDLLVGHMTAVVNLIIIKILYHFGQIWANYRIEYAKIGSFVPPIPANLHRVMEIFTKFSPPHPSVLQKSYIPPWC